ncbi:MAG: DNA polymerase I [Candidatus Omnitrophota bacterium]|nr:MAG: DNA polymerase I [Candidatus Omnitrophota bacterium]RKY43622.1 MAG: DNA polymerase I [Candidatus Omnitrophota bacterium]
MFKNSVKEREFSSDTTLYLIDGSSFSYRAFFAIRGLANSKGLPTGAIFGFLNTLRKIIKEFQPKYLGVCFDVSRRTFRQAKFEDYKISRPPVPNEFKLQIPWIKEIIKHLSIPIAELEGYEADDLIATLAERAKEANFKCLIFSSDKDIFQIIEDRIIMVYNPNKDILYDEEKVIEVFGVKPRNIPDFLALCGDSIDDIPGVKGIGPKNASFLIRNFETIENLLKNIDSLPKESLKRAILDSQEAMLLSKDLALLRRDVPLNLDIKDLKIGEPDYPQLQRLCRELEFKSLLEEFSVESPHKREEVLLKELPAGVILKIKEDKKLIFYLGEDSIFIYYSGEVYLLREIDRIKEILENPQIEKVSFDLKRVILKLNSFNIKVKPPYFDVMVAGYLLKSYLQELSLENLIWEFLGKNFFQIGEAQRVQFIVQLYSLFKERLKEESLQSLFSDIEMPLIEVLAWMEGHPLKINLDYLKEISASLKERRTFLEKEIYSLANIKFNLNSPKQLANVLFNRLSLKPVKKTKTGFSTNEDSLNKLRREHPIVEKILEYRKLTKLLSTYIDPFINQIKQQGRIYPQFSQVGTATGRLVSFSPNLQNIPIKGEEAKKIRGAFVSSFKEGLILSADYSQIELRVLAHISQDPQLIQAFHRDKDIHRFTASLLFSKPPEEISPQEREFAKRINFGIVYGMSPYGLSKELGVSLEEAQMFISEYFLRYPKVEEYIKKVIEEAKTYKYVKTLFGRRRYLENIDSPNTSLREYAFRQAVNSPIQGTAADIIKLAMIKIFKEFKERQIKSYLLIQIHDELVFDVQRQELDLVSSLVRKIMEEVVILDVPLRVNIHWGQSWLEATK